MEKYKNAVLQVSTPLNFGSGFIIDGVELIITNYHLIKGHKEIVVYGRDIPKTITRILYIDPYLDIAFLEKPESLDILCPKLSSDDVKEGSRVYSVGHPFRLNYTISSGIISKIDRVYSGVKYFQVDVPMNPGNSGGPLMNENAEVVGLNTMIIKEAENIGFALPHYYIRESIELYGSYLGKEAIRCYSCRKSQLIEDINNGYCSNCGYKFSEEEYAPRDFKPTGIVAKIENIIDKMGCKIALSRSGPFFWEIEIDNVQVKIIFLSAKRSIVFDVSICVLPDGNIAEFYEFLLQENNVLKNHIFSLRNNEILLSFIIFEEDFNHDDCLALLRLLVEHSKHYKMLLSERFLAKPVIPGDD